MKTARIVILFFALLSFVACDSNDEVIDKTEQIGNGIALFLGIITAISAAVIFIKKMLK